MERIAILTGGDSAEHDISLMSANTILENLNSNKYQAVIVYLINGEYRVENQKLNIADFSYIKNNTKINFDKIFIALHGSPAENGLIQDYLDTINIPYTSCNAKVSALTFDKFKCNETLKKLGFKCANSILLSSEKEFSEEKIIQKLGMPCFVKPNESGSSYGVSKITKKHNLLTHSIMAFLYDKQVIIESYIDGTEVSCGVYYDGNDVRALPITEIISENEFFDYEAKYKGKAQEITPARISNKMTARIQKSTIDIYKKMNLSGICRIDFIIQEKEPYIIEINTIPGFSKESIIPQQLKASNIDLEEIFDVCLSNI